MYIFIYTERDISTNLNIYVLGATHLRLAWRCPGANPAGRWLAGLEPQAENPDIHDQYKLAHRTLNIRIRTTMTNLSI